MSYFFFLNEMCLIFSFPHLPQFDWIFFSWWVFMFCSSLSTWMIFHGISYLLCLLMNQYSLTTWQKFLYSLLSLSLFWLKSFLAWWLTLFLTVWYLLKILSLLDGLSFLNLMNLPILNLSYCYHCLHWEPYQVVLNP